MTGTTRQDPLASIYAECSRGNSPDKLAKLPPFPRLIDVELTNTCNFRCLMCPTGTHMDRRPKGFMSEAVFARILDEASRHGTPLRFVRWGEPTLHPDFLNIIGAAKAHGLACHVNTNGSKLTDDSMARLCALELDSFKFSFQGVDCRGFKEMRSTDFFEGLISVVTRFGEIRGERAAPFLQVATTITYETADQVAEFVARMEPLVDKVSVGHTELEHMDLSAVRLKPDELARLKRLAKLQSLERVHPECPEVFDKISINWDGSVTACCRDYDHLMLIGNITKQTIAEIWRSQKADYYRRMLAAMRHDELPLCSTCYDTMGIFAKSE
ncbi:MAG: radical SAM protein [Rhodospirillales bacterium]|nr:radical SAM protein [Rhodospirillales bacterium]